MILLVIAIDNRSLHNFHNNMILSTLGIRPRIIEMLLASSSFSRPRQDEKSKTFSKLTSTCIHCAFKCQRNIRLVMQKLVKSNGFIINVIFNNSVGLNEH